jgi:glycosyltransferase involved in cell wall biosynthesis
MVALTTAPDVQQRPVEPPADLVRPLLIGKDRFDEVPGGLNRYLGDLAGALRTAGTPAHVLAGGAPVSDPWWTSVPSTPLGSKLTALRREGGRLAAGATVLDVHFALHGWPVLTHPLARRVPMIVHFQGPWADESRIEGVGRHDWRARAAIERSVYRRARRVVVLSDAFGDLVADRYGVDPAAVEVLSPGVDLQRFRPRTDAAHHPVVAQHLGSSTDGPVVVCVRRLAHRMGLDVLIAAWAEVVRAVPTATLVLAGDGAARADLEHQVAAVGLGERVRFLGRVPDGVLPLLYAAADVSVVPTTALEGFGLVTLESLASGTPVVVTDVDGLADVPRRLDRSLVVPPGSPRALADRLVRALHQPMSLPSRSACRRFAEDHGWAAIAARHLEIYREAALASPPGRS